MKPLAFCILQGAMLLFVSGVCGNVTSVGLFPKTARVFENESVQMSFVFNGTGDFTAVWNPLNVSAAGFVVYSSCSAESILNDGNYDVDCNISSITVTIIAVRRSQHLSVWSCSILGEIRGAEYFSQIYVKVAVEHVDIFSSANNTTITANENETIHIRCESSFCRPEATISLRLFEHQMDALPGLTDETDYNNDSLSLLVQTKTNFTFKATRKLNKHWIYCFARNDPVKENSSSMYALEIFYPPNSPPAIGVYQNMSTYRIQEFTTRRINCTIQDSNPESTVDWKCEQALYSQNNISTLQRELVFNVSRGKNANCTCSYTYRGNQTVQTLIRFDVLYPPDKISVDLSFEEILYKNISQSIDVVENKALIFNCTGNGNPIPDKFKWSGAYTSETKYLSLTPSHQKNNTVICMVFNTMNETEENSMSIGNHSQTYRMNILYPPELDIKNGSKVIENYNFTTICTANAGLTTSQSVNWNTSNSASGYRNSTLSITKVTRTMNGKYRCFLNYTLHPTYGNSTSNSTWKDIVIDVLYPPEKFVADLTLNGTTFKNISSTFSVLENAFMTLVCSAGGNPSPSKYNWTGFGTSNDNSLQLSARRNVTESLTCTATNTLTPTDQPSTNASNKQTYTISVLYPPNLELDVANRYSVIENDTFEAKCTAVNGLTTSQSVKWIHNSSSTDTHRIVLSFGNVKRTMNGTYLCLLNYKLNPTYGTNTTDSRTKEFSLDVLYPPEDFVTNLTLGGKTYTKIVSNFSVVENGLLTFDCSAGGNPAPFKYSWSGVKSSDGHSVQFEAKNNSAGKLICTAENKMNATKYNNAGHGEQTYEINILYPPTLLQKRIGNATEGTNLEEDCISSPGQGGSQNISWLKWNETFSNGRNLSIKNITSENEGLYTCIVHVTMKPTYGKNTSVVLNTSFYLYVNTAADEQTRISENTGGSTTVAVVSGILSAALVVALIIVGFAIARKRGLVLFSRNKKSRKGNEYENVGFTHDPKQDKRLPALPPPEEPEVKENVITNNIAETEFYDPEENPYVNTAEVAEVLRISISELFTYVSNKSKKYFYEEFEKFPKGTLSTIPCTFAKKPENVALNRYQGIYPYDHSRVHILEQPAFFINANYIDGYARPRQYIASLGPTERHTLGFTTFWNMIWYEKADVIVMLTNLSEPSGMKCEQYWPDYSKTMEVDNFLIQSETEEEAAEYTVRTFTVLKGEESRMVTQLHYTAWPDKTVPESVTSLIEFRQRVTAAPTRSLGPLVVHCSAGVGRTGTYIALDRLIEEGKSTDYVNVFDCVNNMRKQRVNMVQTPEQYIYLHQALVYCLAFDIEPVTAETIGEYIQTTSNNVFSQRYQQLKQTVEKESDEYIEAQNKHASFIDWNRRRADIPGDRHRVLLSLDKEFGQSNYINAIYLASFLRLDHFIIAQSPLPKTIEDFVGMLYQEKSACIVALDDYRLKGTNNAVYLPAENDHFTYGFFSISCLSVEAKPAYVVRKLKLKHEGKHEQGEKVAYHFEYTAWKHDEKLPKDPKMFVEFVREIENYAKESTEENPHVIVHCMSGSERSGLFCAVSNLIQKMELEQQVSVVNMLRRVRERRRTAISSMEQLKFCYHAVNACVKKTQHLSTRKKSFLVHYENNVQ